MGRSSGGVKRECVFVRRCGQINNRHVHSTTTQCDGRDRANPYLLVHSDDFYVCTNLEFGSLFTLPYRFPSRSDSGLSQFKADRDVVSHSPGGAQGGLRNSASNNAVDRAHYLLLYRCNNNYSSPALVPINPSKTVVHIIKPQHHHLHPIRLMCDARVCMNAFVSPYCPRLLSVWLIYSVHVQCQIRRGKWRRGCPILFRLIVVARIIGQYRLFMTKRSGRITFGVEQLIDQTRDKYHPRTASSSATNK